MKRENIYKLIKYITAFFSVIMIICFIVQLARIFFGNLNPMYSRDLVGKYLLQILPVLILWVLAIIVGLIFSLFVKEKKFVYVKTTEEAKLKILETNIDSSLEDNEDFNNLKRLKFKMNVALIISLVIYAICLVMVSLYLFNPKHFIYNGEINKQVMDMFINIIPWIIIALITLVVYTYYVNYVSKKGVNYAKAIIKTEGKVKKTYKRIKKELLIINLVRASIIVLAITLIIVGVFAGEAQRVYQKAVNICTECIGLG